jgi:hypothetical protein
MSKARILEAVQNLDLESTRKLLDAKPALLAVTDRQGRNLLHLACSASCSDLDVPESVSVRMVNFLLDRGFDAHTTHPARQWCRSQPTSERADAPRSWKSRTASFPHLMNPAHPPPAHGRQR